MGYAEKNFDSSGNMRLKKFSSGQVTHHGAKFAVFFDVPTTPINSITIDEHGVTHGWFVTIGDKNGHGKTKPGLQKFADEMKGAMKIHIAHLRVMKEPTIVDLN